MGAKHSARKRGSNMSDKQFIDDTVKAHNEYRRRHQASSLSHAKELSAQAQKWADHLAATNSFQHSSASLKGERLGENIAMKWSSQPDAYTGQDVTDQWYSEVKMHTFGGEPRTTGTGHFTQVVWKGSREIGVGRAVARDGKVIVVANYRPAGNLLGTYAANVLPPKDGKIVLPAEPASKPTTTTSQFSQGGTRTPEGTFSQRFGDARRDFFSQSQPSGTQAMGTRSQSKSVRTFTTTEGVGPNKVTKTIVEETITKADGTKVVNRSEKTTSGGATPSNVNVTGKPFELMWRIDVNLRTFLLNCHKDEQEAQKEINPDVFTKADFGRLGLGEDKSKPTSKPGTDSSATKKSPQTMDDFHKDCLQAHNEKRKLHGADKLKLASDLSEHAQKWAEKLVADGKFEHSKCQVGGDRVGENIASSWSSAGADYTGDDVVDQWYSEIKKHDYSSDGAMSSGHFTQVVWKGSKELGVGKAKDGKGKCIVVCNYRPAGNMVGDYKANVAKPK